MGQQTTPTEPVETAGKGFDNYIELIPVGTHVDSKGTKVTFTDADFAQAIANTDVSTDAVPIVIGHPKETSPAYGWGKDFKVENGRMYGLFRDVNTDFAEAVEKKSYPNRSISLGRNDKGLYIKHVGFLGGAAPAIKGMAEIQFNEDASEQVFEFNQAQAFSTVGYLLNNVGNLFRSMRDKMIASDGVEAADRFFSEWEINSLQTASERINSQLDSTDNNFSETDAEAAFVDGMVAAAQDKLNAEQAAADAQTAAAAARTAAAAEFAERNDQLAAENQQLKAQMARQAIHAQVAGWQQVGKLTPALSGGVAEFMAGLDAVQTFEFSAANGTQAVSASTWFAEFVERLSPIQLGVEQADGSYTASPTDTASITAAAHEYAKAQSDKGIEVSWTDAVIHVSRSISE